MTLTIGMFCTLLWRCSKKYKKGSDRYKKDVVRSIFRGLLGEEWDNYDDTFNDSRKINYILNCIDHLSHYDELIKKQLETVGCDEYIATLWGEIYSILNIEKIELFLHALRDLEMRDSYLSRTMIISFSKNIQVDRNQLDFLNRPQEYVPYMLLYAALYTDNGDGKSFVNEITDDFVNRFQKTLTMGAMASSVINRLTIVKEGIAFLRIQF